MLEKYLIENCSPTLASLKPANLFSYRYTDLNLLKEYIHDWNRNFKEKDIQILILKVSDGAALIYVYRPRLLQREFQKDGVSDFLKFYGYSGINIEPDLIHLADRIKDYDVFPHEIGLFLGYPLEDVKGFIENAGYNSLCTGCWKVYSNEAEALKKFALFRKCKDIYTRLWQNGTRSLGQLTVAA